MGIITGTEAETTTDEHEEEEENVAVLTDEQMKAVGIEIGSIEQKQLSATLKANGALRVPKQQQGECNLVVWWCYQIPQCGDRRFRKERSGYRYYFQSAIHTIAGRIPKHQ